jgi:hypothetical protein
MNIRGVVAAGVVAAGSAAAIADAARFKRSRAVSAGFPVSSILSAPRAIHQPLLSNKSIPGRLQDTFLSKLKQRFIGGRWRPKPDA